MPTTMLVDAPAWFIVLEYLKVLLTPSFLLLAFTMFLVVLVAHMRRARGMRCSPQYSDLIDRTSALANDVAKRARKGELSAEDMVKHLEAAATTLAHVKRAKDIGDRNPLKEAVHELLREKSAEHDPTE